MAVKIGSRGGLRLEAHKERSTRRSLRAASQPSTLILPLDQHAGVAQRFPHPMHQRMDLRAGGTGRQITPQLVHQPVDRHHAVRAEQQRHEQRTLPAASELHRPVAYPHFDRAQHREDDVEHATPPAPSARWARTSRAVS